MFVYKQKNFFPQNNTATTTTMSAVVFSVFSRQFRPLVSNSRSLILSPALAKNVLPSDETTVNFIDLKFQKHQLTFADLKAKAAEAKVAKDRALVHALVSGVANPVPTFHLVNLNELQALVRKSRKHGKGIMFSVVDLEKDSMKRIKWKEFVVSTSGTQNITDILVAKVRAELEKDNFVRIVFKSGKAESSENFVDNFVAKCLDGELASKKDYLIV